MARTRQGAEFEIEVGGEPYVWRLQRKPHWSSDPAERRPGGGPGAAIRVEHHVRDDGIDCPLLQSGLHPRVRNGDLLDGVHVGPAVQERVEPLHLARQRGVERGQARGGAGRGQLDQRVMTFLGAIRRAFEFLGGAPARLKPDNLRAAVAPYDVTDVFMPSTGPSGSVRELYA